MIQESKDLASFERIKRLKLFDTKAFTDELQDQSAKEMMMYQY